MGDNIFYTVETNKSKCSCCGKAIKNIYHYNNKEYGYYCFMNAIGQPVDKTTSKEKPLPNWAFDLMNEYFEKEKDIYIDEDDFVINFFNEYISKEYDDHPLWNRAIELTGKKIPIYQQYMINDYLQMRLKQYRLEKGLQ